jgi:hypothetical protein
MATKLVDATHTNNPAINKQLTYGGNGTPTSSSVGQQHVTVTRSRSPTKEGGGIPTSAIIEMKLVDATHSNSPAIKENADTQMTVAAVTDAPVDTSEPVPALSDLPTGKGSDGTKVEAAARTVTLKFIFDRADPSMCQFNYPITNWEEVRREIFRKVRPPDFSEVTVGTSTSYPRTVACLSLVNLELESKSELDLMVWSKQSFCKSASRRDERLLPLTRSPPFEKGTYIRVELQNMGADARQWVRTSAKGTSALVFQVQEPHSEQSSTYASRFVACLPVSRSASQTACTQHFNDPELFLNLDGIQSNIQNINCITISGATKMTEEEISTMKCDLDSLSRKEIAEELHKLCGIIVPLALAPTEYPSLPPPKPLNEVAAKRPRFEHKVNRRTYRTVFYVAQLLWTQYTQFHKCTKKMEELGKTSTRKNSYRFASLYWKTLHEYLKGIDYETSTVTSLEELVCSLRKWSEGRQKAHEDQGFFHWKDPTFIATDAIHQYVAAYTAFLLRFYLYKLPLVLNTHPPSE